MIRQIAWRNLKRRKSRTLLTILSIIIGVASTFAVIAAVDSAEKAFPIYLKEAFGKADFGIYGTEAYFPEEIYEEAQSFDNAVSVAVLKENTKLVIDNEDIADLQKRVVLTGYSALNTPVTKFKLIAGDLSAGGALITDQMAHAMGIDVGQTLIFETDDGARTLPITAVVKYTIELMGPGSWGMAKYHHWSVAVPLELVQDWYGHAGKVQGILVKAQEGSPLPALEQQVDALTKQHEDIYMQPITIDFNTGLKDSFFFALYVAGFLGIALSAFVIFNSIYVSVNERKKEFAALKTIGFTTEQVRSIVVCEVLLLSAIGTAIGLVFGYGFGQLLKMVVFMVFGMHEIGAMEPWTGLAVSLLAGMTVPVLASVYPIRQAGKVSVVSVLQDNRAAATPGNKWLGIAGVLLIISAFFIKHIYLVAPLLIGVALVFPYLFKSFNRVLKPVYKGMFGFPGEMAARNLQRNPVRTAMTSLVLCLGISMIVMMGSLNWAMLQTYERVIYSTYGGNLDVMFHHIEKDDLEKLRSIEGVADAQTYALTSAVWMLDGEKRKLPIFGVGEQWIDRFPVFTVDGASQGDRVKQLQRDEIMLDRISFDVWGGKIGESIALQTQDGVSRPFKVVAVVDSMKNNGYSAFMNEAAFQETFGLKYERNALVMKDANTSPLQLRERVFDQFGERIEEMWGPEDWVTVISLEYTSSFSIINILVILAIIVSGIGITNTLVINIMERIRELGMMRAVGVARKQIVRMIQLEGIGLGLIASLIGCIVGILLIYITSSFVTINSLTFDFDISWAIILFCGLFGAAVSWIASFSPARKAAKTPLSEALRYE